MRSRCVSNVNSLNTATLGERDACDRIPRRHRICRGAVMSVEVVCGPLPPEPGGRAGGRRECERLCGLRVWLVVERKLAEVGGRAVAVEVDGRLDALIDDEGIAVQRDERRREHRPHELPHGGAERTVAAG